MSADARTQSDVAAIAAQNKAVQDLPKPGIQNVGGGAPLEKFPAQFYSKHPEEERLRALDRARAAGLVDGSGSNSGVYTKPALDAVTLDYIRSKQEAEELRAFEDWLGNTFDMNDPNVCRYVKTMYPRFFERKMEQIDRDADLMKRIAKMRVKGGPDSVEDLVIQYQIDTGELKLDYINNMIGEMTKSTPSRVIQRGYFNPYRYTGQTPHTAPGLLGGGTAAGSTNWGAKATGASSLAVPGSYGPAQLAINMQ